MTEMHAATGVKDYKDNLSRARVAVRRKKRHKSPAGTRRVHPRGRGIIKFRPAMRGAATLRSCTLSRHFCLPRGWDLVEGYYGAHPGLCRRYPVRVWGAILSQRVSSSHPAIQQPPDNCAWRDASRWRDAPLMPLREGTRCCSLWNKSYKIVFF